VIIDPISAYLSGKMRTRTPTFGRRCSPWCNLHKTSASQCCWSVI